MATVFTNNIDLEQAIDDYLNNPDTTLPPISEWDVSEITSFITLFKNKITTSEKNEKLMNINNWNVSNVTYMSMMFSGCTSFNQPLNNWNVSNATHMNNIFEGCISFNQPLNNWNVSGRRVMSSMFKGCISFNQPLNNWNVSDVISMSSMFQGCTSFNQPLNNWNVSNAKHMNNMFEGCISFNQPLNNWNVSNAKHMNNMFEGCTSFNQPLNNWKIEPTTITNLMFYNCAIEPENMPKLNYPKSKSHAAILPQITSSSHVVGDSLPEGISYNLPIGVTPYNHSVDVADQILVAKRYLGNSTEYNKQLTNQYMHTQCFHEAVDCYVGNRLTTYLLTQHPVIKREYPEYAELLKSELINETNPVVISNRYMSLPKLKEIIKGSPGFPFAYIQDREKEVCLPLGTELRYLGCHVQLPGRNSIYRDVNSYENVYNKRNIIHGALLCEFEVLGISPHLVSVPRLIQQIETDYTEMNPLSEYIASSSELLPLEHEYNKSLRPVPVSSSDVFGRRRRTKRNRSKSKKSKRRLTKKSKKHRIY
jgi:surface protein